MNAQHHSMDNPYYLQYGLSRDPFPTGAFDGVIHLTPALTHRLKLIKKLIEESDKFIVVTSPLGAGRSVLADYLIGLKNPDWQVSFIKASQGLGIDPLAQRLLQNLHAGNTFENKKPAEELPKFLEHCSRNRKLPVLIIDDAHKLPIHTLEFILQLAELRHGESLFRFVLFADELINDLLEGEKLAPLSSEILYKVYIPSLSRKQTEEYIDTRISLCGENAQSPFNDKELNYIYRASGGLPGGINILAKQVMMENLLPEKKRPGMGRYLIGLVLIVLAAAGVYFGGYKEDVRQFAAQYFPGVVSSTEIISEKALAVMTGNTDKEFVAAAGVPAPAAPVDEVMESEMEAVPVPEGFPVADSGAGVEEPVLPYEENGGDLMEADGEAVVMVPEPEAENIQLASDEEEAIGAAVAEDGGAVDVIANENVLSQYVPSEVYASLKGAAWLKQQPGDYYMLQLISAQNAENIEDLLAGLPVEILEQLATYTNYTPSGKPRYLLLFGLYSEKKIADVAIEELPEKFREVKPWPRKLSAVINEIDKVIARGLDVRN